MIYHNYAGAKGILEGFNVVKHARAIRAAWWALQWPLLVSLVGSFVCFLCGDMFGYWAFLLAAAYTSSSGIIFYKKWLFDKPRPYTPCLSGYTSAYAWVAYNFLRVALFGFFVSVVLNAVIPVGISYQWLFVLGFYIPPLFMTWGDGMLMGIKRSIFFLRNYWGFALALPLAKATVSLVFIFPIDYIFCSTRVQQLHIKNLEDIMGLLFIAVFISYYDGVAERSSLPEFGASTSESF